MQIRRLSADRTEKPSYQKPVHLSAVNVFCLLLIMMAVCAGSYCFKEKAYAAQEEAPVPAGEGITMTLPVTVEVIQGGADPVGNAVFHFAIEGFDRDTGVFLSKDTVETRGSGLTLSSLTVTIPDEAALTRLAETGFDVREKTALVDGWSFAPEAWHADLSRTDGNIDIQISSLRKGDNRPELIRNMYFSNYFTKTNGMEGEAPAGIREVTDLLSEAASLENVLFRGTLTTKSQDGSWEVNWEISKSGQYLGESKITLKYTPAGEAQKQASLSDILRVTPEGAYVRLDLISGAYEQLSGKNWAALSWAGAIPSGWTAFSKTDVYSLDLEKTGDFLSRVFYDMSKVLDALSVTKTSNAYLISGDRETLGNMQQAAGMVIEEKKDGWNVLLASAVNQFGMEPDMAALLNKILCVPSGIPGGGNGSGLIKTVMDAWGIVPVSCNVTVTKNAQGEYWIQENDSFDTLSGTLFTDNLICACASGPVAVEAPADAESGDVLILRLLED
ncbi:MAG: hypothetical protein IKN57_08570 [Parasporobacterium sp.]|nr:hypothetical protein [Parasporobacterium sp.]